MAIISIEQLSEYAGKDLSEDKRAVAVLEASIAWAENYTGRVFGEVREFTETHDYKPVFFLEHIDVVEITTLTVWGQAVKNPQFSPDTGRVVLNPNGLETRSRGNYDAIKVSYKSGMKDVPADLMTAIMALTMDNYNKKDDAVSGGIVSESVGGYSTTYGQSTSKTSATGASGSYSGSNVDYMTVLDYYKVRSMR